MSTRGDFVALSALLTAFYITQACATDSSVKVEVDWNRVIAISKTTPTIVACPIRPNARTTSGSVLRDAELSALKSLDARYVRWHMINPARQVAEIFPPSKERTSWDFSKLDADIIPFLEITQGREPILNLTGIPYWLFKTGRPVPQSDLPDDPKLRSQYWVNTKELVDPSGKALGEYFARIASWYTKGGFTDENGKYHHSGYHYDLPWWNVLNEIDYEFESMTPEQYTRYYDAIVSAVREVSPKTKFVAVSLAFPSLQPEFFEYFLNPGNHRPGIPIDMLAYHLYTGAGGLGGLNAAETIEEWQYTFFNHAAAFIATVQYVESIRKRLAPSTRVNLDELGSMLLKQDDIPKLYWNLNAAVYAYLYAELAKLQIDVATLSGIYDQFPGSLTSIMVMNPETGAARAPMQALKLIKDHFGPGDRIVATVDPAVGEQFTLLASPDVATQAFVTAKGRKLLVVNKRLKPVDLDLSGLGAVRSIAVVDERSAEGPARPEVLAGDTLRLGSFAVAVVEFESVKRKN